MEEIRIRDFNFEDAFAIARIIKKMNVRREIKECIKNAKSSKGESQDLAESLGVDIALIVIENIPSAEKEVYSLFGSMTGKKVENVKKMKATEVFGLVTDLFTNEDAKKVFSTALNLKK